MRHANVSVPGATAFLLLLMAVAALLLLPSGVHAVDIPEQEFIDLRVRWREWLIGNREKIEHYYEDPEFMYSWMTVYSAADSWNTMNKDASRTFLWSDLNDNTNPAHITESYKRLRAMALAYSTYTQMYYLNSELKQDLIRALDWMYENRYNEHKKQEGNWWDWEIGTPLLLNDITVLMYDELTESQRKNHVNTVNHFVPDPLMRNTGYKETGLGRAQKGLICAIVGILDKSHDTINKGRTAVTLVMRFAIRDDGFYKDGSYVKAEKIANAGEDGRMMLATVTDYVGVMVNTRWRITELSKDNVFQWAKDSMVPLIYRGAMMDNVRGRAIARGARSQDLEAGREALMSVLRLATLAEPHDALYLKRAVKRCVTEGLPDMGYYYAVGMADAVRLKDLMYDPSIPMADELVMSKVFAVMDRAVHRQPGYGFAVSMFSKRIHTMEYDDGENRKGWYTGMGMTTLYDSDVRQYSEDYWATVDMFRLPGTTTVGDRSIAPPSNGYPYFGTKAWVGGASLDNEFSAVGMDFNYIYLFNYFDGRKSWFMFRNEIVCMGSSLFGVGEGVETIIENRRMPKKGAEGVLTVNGVRVANSEGFQEHTIVRFAHLSGLTDMGYYFPEPASVVKSGRETRTGAWADVSEAGTSQKKTNTFVSLSIPHPKSAEEEESYMYVLLPGKTAAQVADYAQNPAVKVLANTGAVHAAQMTERGKGVAHTVTAANFWDGPAKVSFIQAYSALSVVVKEDEINGTLHVALSDPTQALDTVGLSLQVTGYTVVSQDNHITIWSDASMTYIEVNTKGAVGATFNVVLRKN